jgi:hypothetical protein
LRTIQRFCQDAQSWIVKQTIATVDGTLSYAVVIPDDTRILSIKKTDIPHQCKFEIIEGNIVFEENPTNVEQEYELEYILEPLTLLMEEELFLRNREGIVHGTLAALFMMPKKPWTDLNLHQFYKKEFRRCINREKILINGGLSNQPRGFGA